ncbi:GNAT family N-acetyltransferase [Afifella sp. IM 167]|uniref:GNAT family N-acetyltransferase n=1 Tax=Afifella sp. IM 167 TaxID=2033586 RepID=UPI001CC92632|nr:GNAT family protein [Afifella sp. IM 167]MBZ8133361.1 N-acetyltransferase [Afifella sp. IM 167]
MAEADREPIRPVSLTGKTVELVPLSADHAEGLKAAVADGRLWELWYTSVPSPDQVQAEIARRLALQEAGSMLAFTVLSKAAAHAQSPIVGMTTYMNIDAATPRLEIGSTFYARRVQRTPLNTEAKLLLLGHAFDRLGCLAVEFRTHFFNQQSRRAIERLGAKLDGVLRSHQKTANGALRDTCVYSITAAEWPAVRAHLAFQLERGRD